VVLEDPRTSTPGLAFLLYADAVGGNGFWGKFRTQWLTLAPGWDGAYALFLKKQAPLVWSYTTSQAYHEEQELEELKTQPAHAPARDGVREAGKEAPKSSRYRALVFKEGNPVQVEGAALVKGAFEGDSEPLRKIARDFLEFLLTPEVQSQIPLKNWMLPVIPGTKLPESFGRVPKPLKIVRTPTDAERIEKELLQWKKAISETTP